MGARSLYRSLAFAGPARQRSRRLPLVSLALLLALGLLPQMASAEQPSDAGTASPPSPQGRPDATLDELFNAVAARVPPFGGVFLDEAAGTLSVWVTDGRAESAAQAQGVLAEVLEQPRLLDLRPSALKADYPFPPLKRWHDQVITEVLGMEGVVVTGIDDRINRLRVGVEDEASHRPQVEAKLSDLGIPLEAVVFEQRPAVVPVSSLQDAHRPILGGLKISTGINGGCTLGFIAQLGGGLRENGFVTNSHCTNIPGGVENTRFGQPVNLFGLTVGTEAVDPLYWTGVGCPAGRRCRYSDTAWVRINFGTTFELGNIARPTPMFFPNDWNGASRYRITDDTDPLVGSSVIKVGQASGETTGFVTGTCDSYGMKDTDLAFICQATANFTSIPGDSGSAVLKVLSATDVALQGIVWGIDEDGTGTAFSAMGNIERSDELGLLTVCASTLC